MGVNNKKRRAAKQRREAREQSRRPSAGEGAFGRPRDDVFEPASSYARVDAEIVQTIHRLSGRRLDDQQVLDAAELVLRRVAPVGSSVVQHAVADLLGRLIDPALAGGWAPHDLAELLRRRGGEVHLPALVTVLHDAARRTTGAVAWSAELEALGADPRVRFGSAPQLGSGLMIASLLSVVPLLDTSGLRPASARAAEHPKLARVRALLAKAESTTFDEEAESLTAKAQELIVRYSLERLLATEQDAGSGLVARRIWLDAPYLRAKGSLIHVVATANHCRAALSEELGFSVVVGAAADLDATELMTTSLMVQADSAMLRHGRRVHRDGTSRTRSFRQSFLVAYAARVGQRLEEANDAVVAEDDGRYLPVLQAQAEKASAAFEAAVPHAVGRPMSTGNSEGYRAGLAAADLAQLGVAAPIADRTASADVG